MSSLHRHQRRLTSLTFRPYGSVLQVCRRLTRIRGITLRTDMRMLMHVIRLPAVTGDAKRCMRPAGYGGARLHHGHQVWRIGRYVGFSPSEYMNNRRERRRTAQGNGSSSCYLLENGRLHRPLSSLTYVHPPHLSLPLIPLQQLSIFPTPHSSWTRL